MRMHFSEVREVREDKGERSLPASDSFTFPKEIKAKPMFPKELKPHFNDEDNFEFPKELKPRF